MNFMSYLSLENVSKQYVVESVKVDVLTDVSFNLEDGEFVVVLGSLLFIFLVTMMLLGKIIKIDMNDSLKAME